MRWCWQKGALGKQMEVLEHLVLEHLMLQTVNQLHPDVPAHSKQTNDEKTDHEEVIITKGLTGNVDPKYMTHNI